VIRSRVASRARTWQNLANNERDPAGPGNAARIRRYRAALLRLETDANSAAGLIVVAVERQLCGQHGDHQTPGGSMANEAVLQC
jgi:hypothetical protein